MKKWTKSVHPRKGGLDGWSHAQPKAKRHAAIARRVRETGYKSTIDALQFLANVDEHKNPEVAKVAKRDVRWLEGKHWEEY